MRVRNCAKADFASATEFAFLPIACGLAALACTTTLDPSVVTGGDGEPLTTCELFRSSSSEYLACPEPLTNDAAAVDCSQRDAALADVESQTENALIAARSESVLTGDWWLGGTRDDELVWRWPSGVVFWRGDADGMPEPGAFSVWRPGEPNNESTTSLDPERCLALTVWDDWNDRACSLRLPYVCERAP